jgi:Zn-dependent metalloprotease
MTRSTLRPCSLRSAAVLLLAAPFGCSATPLTDGAGSPAAGGARGAVALREKAVPVAVAALHSVRTSTRLPLRSGLSSVEQARSYARANLVGATTADRAAGRLGNVTGAIDFTLRHVVASRDGVEHVRLQQTVGGVRVFGGEVVVHVARGEAAGMSGNVISERDVEGVRFAPSVTSEDALSRAIGMQAESFRTGDKHHAAKAPTDRLLTERESAELVLFRDGAGRTRLAWHVVFGTELSPSSDPGLWNYILDAHDSSLISKWNGIHTLVREVSGAGGNEKFTHAWVRELDVTPDTAAAGKLAMKTDRLETYDLKEQQSGGEIFSAVEGSFTDAPVNDAHGYAEVTINTLKEEFDLNSIDNQGFVIKSRVHYGRQYENAFWDGRQMTYGDGGQTLLPLSTDLHVVAHEINHGTTTFHSNLTYAGESGGGNEGFSDIAGIAADYAMKKGHPQWPTSWNLAERIFRAPNEALRYMCSPTRDGVSIDRYSNYSDGVDVHFSSGIPNKAFCLTARRLSTDVELATEAEALAVEPTVEGVLDAARLWYDANKNHLTASSDFHQQCQGTYDAAVARGYSAARLKALETSWKEVEVYCGTLQPPPPACDETITNSAGRITSPNFPQAYGNGFSRTWCIVPASGDAVTVEFPTFRTESGYDFVAVRSDEQPEWVRTSGTTAPRAVRGKHIWIRFTTDSSVTETGWEATWTPTP